MTQLMGIRATYICNIEPWEDRGHVVWLTCRDASKQRADVPTCRSQGSRKGPAAAAALGSSECEAVSVSVSLFARTNEDLMIALVNLLVICRISRQQLISPRPHRPTVVFGIVGDSVRTNRKAPRYLIISCIIATALAHAPV